MNSLDVQLKCPACGSAQVEVYRQPGSKFANFGSIPVMSCRDCRTRLRGDDVPEEAIAMLKFGGFSAPRKDPPRPTPSVNRQRPVAKKPVVKKPVVKVAPPAPKAPEPEPVVEVPAPAVFAYGPCAWKDCEKGARKGSKYCSRSCSNKNARYRYAQKKRN